MQVHPYSYRELSYAGLFGAMALLLPVIFHLVHLGSLFMPMYLPLVALSFFVRPVIASVTAGMVPLLSAMISGMPPFFPPIAPVMAVELALVAGLIAIVSRSWPRSNEWLVLGGALAVGRIVFVALIYLLATWMALPAGFLSGVSFVSGWPGLILMMVVVPPFARLFRPKRMAIHAPIP